MSRNGLQKWFDRIQTSQGSSQNPHQATRGANSAGRNPATPIVRANNSDVPLSRSPLGLQSSVRLRVRDAKGVNYGSGTIIESRPDKTLILTCGHIFRAMNKAAETVYRSLLENGDQKAVIDIMQTRMELYDYLGYHEYEQKLDALFAEGKNK